MMPWSDPQRWRNLCAGEGCPLCDPQLTDVICELPTARVRAPSAACLPGYVCVVYRRHVAELHDLSPTEAAAFIQDVCRVSAAVQRLTNAAKINLLSLGNLVPHLHMHICPRRPGDRFEGRAVDPGDVCSDVYGPGEHAAYIDVVRKSLGGHSDGCTD